MRLPQRMCSAANSRRRWRSLASSIETTLPPWRWVGAVFVAGMLLSNGRYRIGRFEQQALGRVMHPLNTAAEITVLLLLGLLVKPAALLTVLPLGLALAIVLPLARLLAVWAVLPAGRFPGPDRLVVAGCGLRAAVPLALAVSMTEELPHLRGVAPALAEPLGAQLLALIFMVVLRAPLLQTLVMRRLLDATAQRSMDQGAAQSAS